MLCVCMCIYFFLFTDTIPTPFSTGTPHPSCIHIHVRTHSTHAHAFPYFSSAKPSFTLGIRTYTHTRWSVCCNAHTSRSYLSHTRTSCAYVQRKRVPHTFASSISNIFFAPSLLSLLSFFSSCKTHIYVCVYTCYGESTLFCDYIISFAHQLYTVFFTQLKTTNFSYI